MYAARSGLTYVSPAWRRMTSTTWLTFGLPKFGLLRRPSRGRLGLWETRWVTLADFTERADFDDAERGFIAALDPPVIRNDDGVVVWDGSLRVLGG